MAARYNESSVLESDIPGASLCGRDPRQLKIPGLKRWLVCRGGSARGNKADLVARYIIIVIDLLYRLCKLKLIVTNKYTL